MHIQLYNPAQGPVTEEQIEQIVSFLFKHLDAFGDKREDIRRCLDYVFNPNKGGFVVLGFIDAELVGAVVVNETGMGGYIPENILVYIAVHSGHRGAGLGKQLMQAALENAKGAVALHVEPHNPARYLYQKLGFVNKYLEMRWQSKENANA